MRQLAFGKERYASVMLLIIICFQNSKIIFFLALIVALSDGIELKRIPVQEEEPVTEPPSPGLYAFGYAAGRYPGNIDRTHSEVSDGSGVVRGKTKKNITFT